MVHVEELLSPGAHEFDQAALRSLLGDAEVQAWIADLRAMALVPEKRS